MISFNKTVDNCGPRTFDRRRCKASELDSSQLASLGPFADKSAWSTRLASYWPSEAQALVSGWSSGQPRLPERPPEGGQLEI